MYKLINNKTKEEHLCEKVTINRFDYYYNNEISKIGDTVYNYKSEEIYKITENPIVSYEFPIIATNNPSIDLPQIVDEVEKLARNFATKPINTLNSKGTITCLLSQNGFEKGPDKMIITHKNY